MAIQIPKELLVRRTQTKEGRTYIPADSFPARYDPQTYRRVSPDIQFEIDPEGRIWRKSILVSPFEFEDYKILDIKHIKTEKLNVRNLPHSPQT